MKVVKDYRLTSHQTENTKMKAPEVIIPSDLKKRIFKAIGRIHRLEFGQALISYRRSHMIFDFIDNIVKDVRGEKFGSGMMEDKALLELKLNIHVAGRLGDEKARELFSGEHLPLLISQTASDGPFSTSTILGQLRNIVYKECLNSRELKDATGKIYISHKN